MTRIFNRNKSNSCEKILSKYEWKILYEKFNEVQEAKESPKIEEIYYWIARLGEYVNRKSDHPPGIISIWKG